MMQPKWPVEFSTAEGLRQIYAGYLADHYDLEEETKDWKVYVLREPAETVSRSPEDEQENIILKRRLTERMLKGRSACNGARAMASRPISGFRLGGCGATHRP